MSVERMRILNFVFRYGDQALAALAFLAINVITPLVVEVGVAANVLYMASWAILGSAVSASFLGTPLISSFSVGKSWIIREIMIFYLVGAAMCFVLLGVCSYFLGWSYSFVFFVVVWGGVELIRRSFLVRNNVLQSFLVSLVATGSIFLGLLFLFISNEAYTLWACGAVISGGLVLFFAIFLIVKTEEGGKREVSLILRHAKYVLESGSHIFLSFVIFWAATQGVFIVFFNMVDSHAFVGQKLMFSVLGILGVLMAVQENKYQPLYSSAVEEKNLMKLIELDKAVRFENLALLPVSLFFMALACFVSPDVSVLIGGLMVFHRQAFSSAKRMVYFLRALGEYKSIVLINFISCAACYVVIYYLIEHSLYSLSYGFAMYGFIFYVGIWLLNKSKEREVAIDWHS